MIPVYNHSEEPLYESNLQAHREGKNIYIRMKFTGAVYFLPPYKLVQK